VLEDLKSALDISGKRSVKTSGRSGNRSGNISGNRHGKTLPFAIDTETTSPHPMLADLVGISFSYQPHQAFYIPLAHVPLESRDLITIATPPESLKEQPDMAEVLALFKPLLEDPSIPKVGQNIKYDYIVLAKNGIEMQGMIFDTMIGSYLLNPSYRGHGLDQIALDLLGHRTIKYEDVAGKGKNQILFSQVDIEKATPYACEDADITLMAYEILKKRIEDSGLAELMESIEMPLVPVLARMEMHGIKVDVDKLQTLSKALGRDMELLEKDIFAIAGESFNINSSQQLGNILFEKLQLPVQKKTKKKTGYSTDIDVLTKLAEQHELPAMILRYRSLAKLKSTYTDSLQSLANPDSARIHTSFNQTITATGRLSSSEPNLQNIPIRTEEGEKSGRHSSLKRDGNWWLLTTPRLSSGYLHTVPMTGFSLRHSPMMKISIQEPLLRYSRLCRDSSQMT